jgi:hypothetical protein
MVGSYPTYERAHAQGIKSPMDNVEIYNATLNMWFTVKETT